MSEERPAVVRVSSKPSVEDYEEILDLAERGDRSVLPRVREMLDKFPTIAAEVGDLTRIAKGGMLDMLSENNVMIREAEERYLAGMVQEIAGPQATPIEKLLAEQIAVCWLHVRHVEIKYAHLKSYTLSEAEYYHRCLDLSQKRYLRAIKTLAQIRKLGVPALQVNIAAEGGKQVNLQKGINSEQSAQHF